MKRTIALILCMCSMAFSAGAANRVGRPMIIHRIPEMKLEIWTEQDPQWETHSSDAGGAFTFIAETPALTYPPAHMSWTVQPKLQFQQHEIAAAARGALHQVAATYRVPMPQQIEQKSYGELTGYETTFQAESDNLPIDVRIFCGHRPGQPAVVMQVVTLKDKLPHLSEHIRRSWSKVRYLN